MNKIFNIINKIQKPAVWILLVLNFALVGGYVYAVNRTVFNVVAADRAESGVGQGSASVGDLESEYLSLKNRITLDYAYSLGFQDASGKQIFVAKKPINNTLSFNAL